MPIPRTPAISATTSAQHLRVAQQDAANARRVIALNRATDDGAGNFVAPLGTVNYAGKAISLRVVSLDTSTTSYKSDYEDAQAFETSGTSPSTSASNKGGEYGTTTVSAQQLGKDIRDNPQKALSDFLETLSKLEGG